METSNTKIVFAVYMWRSVYVIKSQLGHYLWKDGDVHSDAGLGTTCNGSEWEDRLSAEDFLDTWNSLHNFNRIETVTAKV